MASRYILSFKPAIGPYGHHDPAAALFADGTLVFGTEEERYTRKKHAPGTFPTNAIRACLEYEEIDLADIEEIIVPYDPDLVMNRLGNDMKRALSGDDPIPARAWSVVYHLRQHLLARIVPDIEIRDRLGAIASTIPSISYRSHHKCHAASAFYPTEFDKALVVTIDGRGEYDATVIWSADCEGLKRLKTYEFPNSLGHFYGSVTEYLGYHAFNGEGKVMGLAPYGKRDSDIETILRGVCDFGADYDVTAITELGIEGGADRLENLFNRPGHSHPGHFEDFHENLAFTVQTLLEETVLDIVGRYMNQLDTDTVAFAGGVALNCKMNKRVMEHEAVDDLFIQPVAHDAGLTIGAGWLESNPEEIKPMTNVYWGPQADESDIVDLFETNKIRYTARDDIPSFIAEQLADGALVGWVQGRQEMGPRALGNRSILADPRTKESLNRVNKYVKHREPWRPFAPSMLEKAADRYLVNPESAPYMIKTFDTVPEMRKEIEGVVHPADQTTRPQTVRKEQNPRYYQLISEFESITGVPVVLNTSFNDHAEPIVTTPKEALQDFYSMGLDLLVMDNYVVAKPESQSTLSQNDGVHTETGMD